jgi:hypothetical protein
MPANSHTTIDKAITQAYAGFDHTAGGGWLQPIRDHAMQAFAKSGFPTRRDEDWKYTDLTDVETRIVVLITRAGDGSYFDARSAADLGAAVTTAVSAPYRVYAVGADEPIAAGTVGGGPIELELGQYRVEVLTEPVFEFTEVVLEEGGVAHLELPEAQAEAAG